MRAPYAKMLPVTLLLCGAMIQQVVSAELTSYHVVLQGTDTDPTIGAYVGKMIFSTRSTIGFTVTTTSGSCVTFTDTYGNIDRGTRQISQSCNTSIAPNAIGVSPSAIKVVSSSPMDLQVFTQYPSGSSSVNYEGYHAIPDEHLGREYYAVTYCTMGGVCQLSITAIENDTIVTVKFAKTVNTTGSISCLSSPNDDAEFHVPLNEMEVLHIESTDDLTGTLIVADAPIAVFAGARNVPSASGTDAFMFEQMIPVPAWGTRHFMVPNIDNDAGDLIKIVTREKATTITITGFSPFIIPGAGDSIVRRIDWESYSVIESSYPVMIAQLSSVDLYNDTSAVTGNPSMLILQAIEHWQTVRSVSCPYQNIDNRFVLISRTAAKADLAITDEIGADLSINATGWSIFPGSEVSLNVFQHTTAIYAVKPNNQRVGIYAFCKNAGIYTGGMDLTTETQGCMNSVAMAGDGVDNDCDGNIDSVQCTEQDKQIQFTSNPYLNGSVNVLTINPTGIESVKFSVTSCGMVQIQLRSSEEGHYVDLRIVGTEIVGTLCSPDCVYLSSNVAGSFNMCASVKDIELFWLPLSTDSTKRKIQVFTDGITESLFPPITSVAYDKLMFTSLVETANFEIDLMRKDCAKIKSGDNFDTRGFRFIVPMDSTEEFVIYITPASQVSVKTNEGTIIVDISSTSEIQHLNLSAIAYKWLTLETPIEVSMYLMTPLGEMHIIPVDVLGPAYTLNTIDNITDPVCKVYPVGSQVTVMPDEEVVTNRNGRHIYMNSMPTDNYLYSPHLSAVFCQQWNSSAASAWVQIPPLETLGSKELAYYIPAMDFAVAKVSSATVYITTTADSTYIQVTGDYSEEIVKDRRGETHTRKVANNKLYKITVVKAVLVILMLVNKVDPSLKVSAVIPHASQYTNNHVVPPVMAEIVASYGVANDGSEVASLVAVSTEVQTRTYTKPTFTITVYKYSGKDMRVLLSDVKYDDNNKRCLVSSSTTPGNDDDDDCDGLTDEEVCVGMLAGEVDSDIDGSINEDCGQTPSNTYTTPSNAVFLNWTSADITCVTEVTSAPVTTPAPPPNPTPSPDSIRTPPLITSYSVPVLPEIIISAGVIQVATTTPAPGSTAAPVETCVTQCVCPCGWVSERNLTEAQIKEAVAEIQEKLKMDKKSLSAEVRKKTSARDDRPSATAVGYVGLSFLIVCIGAIVLLDFTTITRDLRMLRENMRQLLQI